jgi:hypothetical protein
MIDQTLLPSGKCNIADVFFYKWRVKELCDGDWKYSVVIQRK